MLRNNNMIFYQDKNKLRGRGGRSYRDLEIRDEGIIVVIIYERQGLKVSIDILKWEIKYI